MAQKVTSTDIKLALKEFHNGKPSYFITECKTCSTYFPDPQGLLKFDGLAITKSYTNAPLESINRELREELGIELYVNTLPQIEDNSVSGFLMVKRVGEPVKFL